MYGGYIILCMCGYCDHCMYVLFWNEFNLYVFKNEKLDIEASVADVSSTFRVHRCTTAGQ